MNNFSDHIPFFEEDAPPAYDEKGSGISSHVLKKKKSYNTDYLEQLNPEQQQAVMNTEGPLLVLAGAGTGKTRVLTTRISHILRSGLASPQQILAVTFTNKAAREMKTRIGELIGEIVEGMPWLGTFHSTGAKILRRHAELVDLKRNFTILNSDDVLRLLKQLIQAEGLDDKRWPARNLAMMIDSWKNQGLSPEHISKSDAHSFGNGMGRNLYYSYQNRLKDLNACDFGDLLLHSISIFQHNPDILREYHSQFRYILVDEYQDTNTAQYLWLRLLAQHPQGQNVNLCCVGDDDQSIYGWRGAKVENILRFEKDFPSSQIIRLERNYRSTSHILKAASHLIAHNEERLGKVLFSAQIKSEEEKVKIHSAWDSAEEARAIGEEIERAQQTGHALNHMAILVRASFQMREFEDRFVTLGLNYRVIGGPRFYERMEIRDAMAYLRVVVHPADDLAFERIINTPKRGIGDATLRSLYESARARSVSLFSAAADIIETDELKPKARSALRNLIENFRRWQNMLQDTPHRELAEIVLEDSGYTTMWLEDRSPEAPTRLENLKEMIRSMEQFENLQSFLEHVALVMETENNENMDAVNIMTLHSAKGLEFETVFLPGWEEGLFPHQRSLDEGGRSGLEEERRLAYVGLTRAKKHLHIWFVSNRRVHGLWQSALPSRFLDELPAEHIEAIAMETSYGGYGKSSFQHNDSFYNDYVTPRKKHSQKYKNIEGKVIAQSISHAPSNFSINDRIFHIKFGYGRITAIDDHKLTIMFEKAGEKRVLDNFVDKA
ncbi:ATP-dependent helicase [Bartonella krasnovii]|uniref:DNA 3'-5' helicase n=1 Tax=Bartonella krasnovii TaxID=2267275 RepID=A0A5B9D1M1_9HYPH|nr:UvrD-helicase domain-containing protein [Bartonella krasnovii]QEE12456.1 AAA family ATPase [Bartonella krasnovii]UNF28551.1 UvrD-helicase domain-containing protein [Bartonella krasnovii]UNF34929.1 UvrD-helicase domain-containing protein [Bartonella krasnovii]UNF36566.1 UvrD-helicase domain-containing protein [Bartonella krasnovii]UNF38199.1 UvrD-helicase domain-containing protein [Bartonella krasnovii]